MSIFPPSFEDEKMNTATNNRPPWRSAVVITEPPTEAAYLGWYGEWRYWVRGKSILALWRP